ncbi:hypothetical protein ACT1UH_02960 [Mycoplasma sp. 332]|uniref:hypothetical protein n=1 Tax=Mycoplasma sp. 332 TaxID=3458236 RepID=UPI00403693CE
MRRNINEIGTLRMPVKYFLNEFVRVYFNNEKVEEGFLVVDKFSKNFFNLLISPTQTIVFNSNNLIEIEFVENKIYAKKEQIEWK